MAMRQTNDWKLSIYNDANGLVSSKLINGSTCGSVFIGDKGGYSFKLPTGSSRYYLAVESACASSTKKDCVVDTSEYSILRDVDKVYSGKLTAKKVTTTGADLTLTNCGLNNGAVISVKVENGDLAATSKLAKLPINVQIGSTACRILTPELSTKDPIIGSVVDSSEIIDSVSTAKDSAKIVLNDCGSERSKVTLTGSKLDLVNFNPDNATESVVIPIKVNIGDFHCETKEVFYIAPDATGTGVSYSNLSPQDIIDSQPVEIPVVEVTKEDPVVAALASAKNIGISQKNALKSATDIQAYYVDTGSKTDVNFEFNCLNSTRFENDWTLSIYDAKKAIVSTQIINGSDCAIGQVGDNGVFSFSISKNSPRSCVVIQSACGSSDSTCVVDSSQYEIKRLIPAKATTVGTGTTSTTTVPNTPTTPTTTVPSVCFNASCDVSTEKLDFPVFGAK